MKKILWLLSALILFVTSCATTAPEIVESKSEEKIEESVKEDVIETIIVDVYMVSSEVLKASDGIVDGYVEYIYDEMGTLLEKIEFDSEKKPISRMVNEVSGGKIVKTQWFSGENNEPGIYIIKKYDGMNLINETSFDAKDVAQTISTYEYDGDQLVQWTVSSGDNVPMMVTEYENKNGLRNKATFKTPLGEIEGYIDYSWIDGNIESEKTYDEDEDLQKAIEFEYDNGNLVKEIHYKRAIINHTIEYELDDNGNIMNKKHFYRSGNLKAQWDYEYISMKKEVQQ